MRVRWSSLALRRAADIVDYIARDRPRSALDWIDGLHERLDTLTRLPEQGLTVPEWQDSSLRQITFGDYRVIYRIGDEWIDIMTIKHGRQQLHPPEREF